MTLGKHIMAKIDAAADELGIDITQEQFEAVYAKASLMRKQEEAALTEERKAARLEKILAQTEKLKAKSEDKKSTSKDAPEKSALTEELEAAEAALQELKESEPPKQKRKTSPWGKFRTANKGLGMTQEEMKEAFHALTEEEREEFK
jgi:hypothetical protein